MPIDENNGACGVIDAACTAPVLVPLVLAADGWKDQALHRGLSAAHRWQQSPGCGTCSVEYLVRVQPVLLRKTSAWQRRFPCPCAVVHVVGIRMSAIMCTSTNGHCVPLRTMAVVPCEREL